MKTNTANDATEINTHKFYACSNKHVQIDYAVLEIAGEEKCFECGVADLRLITGEERGAIIQNIIVNM